MKARFGCGLTAVTLALALNTALPSIAETDISKNPDIEKFTILSLNDVYNASPVDKGTRGGLARVMTIRKDIEKKQPNILFLLAGDTISPSVTSRAFKGKQMIEAWNALGIDCATFGNHEFDFGPEVLKERISESKFQWLCANAIDKKTGQTFANLPPYIIKQVGTVKVGIIGLVTQDTAKSSKAGPEVEFRDPIKTALHFVPEMRAHGAKVIVALTHLSMPQDKELAEAVRLDVTIGGHEHQGMAAVANGDLIVKAISDARDLAKVDVNYSSRAAKVQSVDMDLIPVTDKIATDTDVQNLIDQFESKMEKELAQAIGRTTVELDGMQQDNETAETNLGDFIADAYREENGSDICIINGGSIRSNQNYGPGDLTQRDALSILPFENRILQLEVTGKTVRQMLEHGVSQVGSKISGRFPQVSGIELSYDARKPAGERLVEVKVNGAALDDDRKYTLATNGYVAAGGDGYNMVPGLKVLSNGEDGNTESGALINHLQKLTPIAPKVSGRITRIDASGR